MLVQYKTIEFKILKVSKIFPPQLIKYITQIVPSEDPEQLGTSDSNIRLRSLH